MKPIAPEKPKSPPKPAKVFDIAHPGKGTPSATSRPVIVSNRPLLQDPMVSSTADIDLPADEKQKLSPTESKIVIKPVDDTDLQAQPENSSADVRAKTIAELAADKAHEKAEAQSAEEPQADEADDTPKATTSEAVNEPTPDTQPAAKTANQETAKATANTSTTSTTSTKSEDLAVDDKDVAETAALEAEAKKLEAINALVDSKQYFLPINAVERQRSKIMSALGLLLILALGLVLFDLLLDVGFIRINGVKALTHFFVV